MLSEEVNTWFRKMIEENKKSRKIAEVDDLLQSLLNAGDKYSK